MEGNNPLHFPQEMIDMFAEIAKLQEAQFRLDNNYFDLLPGVPAKCFIRTSLSSGEVKQRLMLHGLNDLGKKQ